MTRVVYTPIDPTDALDKNPWWTKADEMPVLVPAHTSFPNPGAEVSVITDAHACPLSPTPLAVNFGLAHSAMTMEPRSYIEPDPGWGEQMRLAREHAARLYPQELARWEEAVEDLASSRSPEPSPPQHGQNGYPVRYGDRGCHLLFRPITQDSA